MQPVSQLSVCPMAGTWEELIPKTITPNVNPITVTKAVQLEFGRGPLSSLQKKGRAATAAKKASIAAAKEGKTVKSVVKANQRKKRAVEVAEVDDVAPPALSTRAAKKAKK